MLIENNFDLLEEFLLLNEDIQSHQIQGMAKNVHLSLPMNGIG